MTAIVVVVPALLSSFAVAATATVILCTYLYFASEAAHSTSQMCR